MTNPYAAQPIKAYARASHTAAKTRQVVMLYDGVIRFLNQAKEAMETGEIEKRFQKLSRASDIIMGMQNCLDFSAGNTTAQVLYDFYSSIDSRILQMHRMPKPEFCAQVIAELKEMRDVWDSIDRSKDGTIAPMPAPEIIPVEGDEAASVKFSA